MLPATSAKSTTLDVNAVKAPSTSRLPITQSTGHENQGRLLLAFRVIHYRGLYVDATRFLLQTGSKNAYFHKVKPRFASIDSLSAEIRPRHRPPSATGYRFFIALEKCGFSSYAFPPMILITKLRQRFRHFGSKSAVCANRNLL
jgi:hypothetical protein